MFILQQETVSISIANFWENFLLEKYDFSTFQSTTKQWSVEKQSFFIGKIFKNFPVTPLPILYPTLVNEKTKYIVIDGKQRLHAIINFIENQIALKTTSSTFFDKQKFDGLYFKDLARNKEVKIRFWKYLLTFQYINTDNREILKEVFQT